jgi:sulfur relay protein TusB/DsrH
MALHIIKSGQASAIAQVERLQQDDDQVLLLEDGCYLYTLAQQKLSNVQAMASHMESRGLAGKAKDLGIELISIKQWALLTRQHPQIMTW